MGEARGVPKLAAGPVSAGETQPVVVLVAVCQVSSSLFR